MDPRTRSLQLAAFAMAMCAYSLIGNKRSRSEADDESCEGFKRKRNDVERGELRQGIAQRILRMDAFVFKKMFRMSKEAFLLLLSKVEPIIAPAHAPMGRRSSVSNVDALLQLATTLRWLAGGNVHHMRYVSSCVLTHLH
jgi:hypothetical protein